MLWGKKPFKSTTIHPLARRPPCPSPRGAWAEGLRLCVTGKATVFLAISGPLLQDSVHRGGKEEPLTNASQGRKQRENGQMLPTGRCGATVWPSQMDPYPSPSPANGRPPASLSGRVLAPGPSQFSLASGSEPDPSRLPCPGT